MTWLDKLLGPRVFIAGTEVSPRASSWDFLTGASAVYNSASKRLEFTLSGGGGGSGHTIQDEGVSLTTRALLDVVGPNVVATDTGTKTRISVPAINLAGVGVNVTGSLPIGSVGPGFVKVDGSTPFTGDQSVGTHKLTNLGTPTTGTDAATKGYVDAAITPAAIDWKSSVRFATAAALPASTRVGNVRTANVNGAFPVTDGVTAIVADRLLDKDHATGADRGLWTVTSLGSGGTPWVLTRATDFDADAEVTTGATCMVEEGTANGGKFFFLTTTGAIVVNTTSLVFTALSGLPSGSASGQALIWNGSAWLAGAVDLADSDAVTGQLAYSKLAAGTAGQWLTANASGVIIGSDVALTSKTISISSSSLVGAQINLRHSRGTSASPTAHVADDELGSVYAQGHDGTAYDIIGGLSFSAEAAGGTSKRARFESYLHDGTALVRTGTFKRFPRTPTTNATLTTVLSVAIAADTTVKLSIIWHGHETSPGTTNIAHRETSLTVRRSGAGNVVEISHSDSVALFKDDGSWGDETQISYALNTGTQSVDIKVQGKAATNITWTGEVSYSVY